MERCSLQITAVYSEVPSYIQEKKITAVSCFVKEAEASGTYTESYRVSAEMKVPGRDPTQRDNHPK